MPAWKWCCWTPSMASAEKGKAYSKRLLEKRDGARQDRRKTRPAKCWPASSRPRTTPISRAATWSSRPCSRTAKSRRDVTEATEAVIPAGGDLRLQHLDAADHRPGAGLEAPGAVHRHSLLLAGGQDAAGGDHRRREDRRRGARARALDYVQQIRKTPIVVNDSRGFYTSRVFSTYVKEGLAHAGRGREAGADRERRENGRHAGGPAGRLRRGHASTCSTRS